VDRQPIRPQGQPPKRSVIGIAVLVISIVTGILLLARSACLDRDGYGWFWIPPVGCERVDE
jgi:hypothetical protein